MKFKFDQGIKYFKFIVKVDVILATTNIISGYVMQTETGC